MSCDKILSDICRRIRADGDRIVWFLEFLSNFGGAHLMKKNYERVVLTVLAFDAKDVITTSGWFGEPDGPIVLPEDVLG